VGKKTHILYGLATAAVMIAAGTTLQYFIYVKDSFSIGITFLLYIPFFAGIFLNALAFSKANDGYVSFNDVFASCFKAVLIVLAARIAWFPIGDLLFPQFREHTYQTIHTALMNNPKLSDSQVETGYSIAKKVWYLTVAGTLVFTTLAFGAVFSLAGSAFAEKKGIRIMGRDNF
jgi:hypothetical protein